MRKLLLTSIFILSFISLRAEFSASYCEQSTEKYAIKHYTSEVRFGPLKVKPSSVSIKRLITTSVIDGQRYKTEAQAHITYTGSTGGDTTEVRYFEAAIENGSPNPSFVYFKEIKAKK
jgi:hypothetical protein